MRHERGAILVVVLAALAMMAILASTLARSAYLRMLAANDFRRAEEGAREERDARGGNRPDDRATIGDGAAGASSSPTGPAAESSSTSVSLAVLKTWPSAFSSAIVCR